MHRETDVGFDPGSPGSRPGLKAGAKPLRHPGIPDKVFYRLSFNVDSLVFCLFSFFFLLLLLFSLNVRLMDLGEEKLFCFVLCIF